MFWNGTIHRNSTDMLQGVDGYFGLGGFGIGNPVLPVLARGGGTSVSILPGQEAGGATNPFFLSRTTFVGTNLAFETRQVGVTTLPVFTSGTITGIIVEVNPALDTLIQALAVGVSEQRRREIEALIPQVNTEDEFVRSATIQITGGTMDAVAMSQAILQGYAQRSPAALEAFLDQFNHFYEFAPLAGSGIQNTLLSGFGNADLLQGGPSFDNLFGGGGNDTLIGGAGMDNLSGGAGSDFYLPGPGPDVVGDDGTNPNDVDVISYENATAGVVLDLNFLDGDQSAGDAQGDMISGIEVAIGSPFNDVIHGSSTPTMENDTLIGGAGDDVLIGYEGSDRLQGGPGFDTLIGGGNNGTITQGRGDTAVFSAASNQVNIYNGPNGSLLVAAPGGGVDTLFGIEFVEFIGGGQREVFSVAQLGRSQRNLNFGDDQNNTINGTNISDQLFGRGGNDLLRGFAGADEIRGGDGADTIDGGDGDDFIFGGESELDLRDVVFAGNGDDLINGGHGNDELNGGDGADTIEGGFGADTIIGNAGNDLMTGSAFGDLMFGGGGIDFVNGGFGSDRLNGGDQGDRFFHLGIADHGNDWIQDYNAAEGDRLVYGGTATRDQFQINTANTANAGAQGVSESFVIYRPTGQILWALVDGDGQNEINLQLGDRVFDLT